MNPLIKYYSFWRRAVLFMLAMACLTCQQPAAAQQQPVPAVSSRSDSWDPVITPDGRYVLFASSANNLALTTSNSAPASPFLFRMNVYLRDRTNHTTTLVSVNSSGTGGGNDDSTPAGISTNGQFALFESCATNLLPGDTNSATNVFVRDLVNRTNILVSVSTNGGWASGISSGSVMTPDGRYVAFVSTATNLVAGAGNYSSGVFVRDLIAGVTTYASPGVTGATNVYAPQITPDGRYVAFLGYNSGSGVCDVFVRDLVGGTNIEASIYIDERYGRFPFNFPYLCYNQVISDNGQFVAFEVTTGGGYNVSQYILCYQMQGGSTQIISTNPIASPSIADFRTLDITPDGRFITYVGMTNSTSSANIFVWDGQTGSNTIVGVDPSNNVPANGVCDWPSIDSSGRYVSFLSTATNLTTNVIVGDPDTFVANSNSLADFHLYVRDLQSNVTRMVDVDLNGAASFNNFMTRPSLTPDGAHIVFDCTDANLVTNDQSGAYDVFVCDLASNTIELVSQSAAQVFLGQVVFWPGSGAPALTWPAVAGKTYAVQYKNFFTDTNWQSVTNGVTIVGDTGYATHLPPNPGQRYYRVVAQ
jgi:Tol biopolymer transport system component